MSRPAQSRDALRRRERRSLRLGWTLTALGLIVAAIWLQSAWWYRGYEHTWWAVSCNRGILTINRVSGWTPPLPNATPFVGKGFISFRSGLALRQIRFTIHPDLAPRRDPISDAPIEHETSLGVIGRYTLSSTAIGGTSTSGAPVRVVSIAFWPLAVLLLIPGLLLLFSTWRARIRQRGNRCRGCGYDRAGLGAGAKCPECGRSVPSSEDI